MRIPEPRDAERAEGDLTPMIDMTFQLIAFFMVLINFTDAEQDQRVRLPISDIAKPPDAPLVEPRTIHLMTSGIVSFAGEEVHLTELESLVRRDARLLQEAGKSLSDVTVIIRADRDAPTGQVQEIMEMCQKVGYEKFALRAREPPGA